MELSGPPIKAIKINLKTPLNSITPRASLERDIKSQRPKLDNVPYAELKKHLREMRQGLEQKIKLSPLRSQRF
jgi:hypothetical protein